MEFLAAKKRGLNFLAPNFSYQKGEIQMRRFLKILKLAVFAALVSGLQPANATIILTNTGLASAGSTITFDEIV